MDIRHLLSYILSSFFLIDFLVAGESKDEMFHVQPGAGIQTVKIELGNFGCSFTYAAQGGTNEEWGMSIDINFEAKVKAPDVICTVQRGIESYIFFEKFSLTLTGPGVAITEKETLSSVQAMTPLSAEEFTVDTNTISSVEGKFRYKLGKVAAFSAGKVREDL